MPIASDIESIRGQLAYCNLLCLMESKMSHFVTLRIESQSELLGVMRYIEGQEKQGNGQLRNGNCKQMYA